MPSQRERTFQILYNNAFLLLLIDFCLREADCVLMVDQRFVRDVRIVLRQLATNLVVQILDRKRDERKHDEFLKKFKQSWPIHKEIVSRRFSFTFCLTHGHNTEV